MPRLLSRSSSRNRSRKSSSRTVEQEGELSTPEKKQIFIPFLWIFIFLFFYFSETTFRRGLGIVRIDRIC